MKKENIAIFIFDETVLTVTSLSFICNEHLKLAMSAEKKEEKKEVYKLN